MNQIARCDRLPERSRWSYLGTTRRVLREKLHRQPNNKFFIEAFSVKMAGYWPGSFLASLWTTTPSRSINTQKRTWPISSHFDRKCLVNEEFVIWLLWKLFSRDTAGSPESPILPARVANHSARFVSSCPLAELAI